MRVIITCLIFISFKLCAQSNIRPLISLGYYQTFTDNLWLNELELGAGIQFNDYLSTQINFRGSQDRLPQDPSRSFRVASLSIEPSYRILGKKHIFSPVIAYDAGLEIANNGTDKFIYTSNYIYFPTYQQPYSQYNKGLYFGKAKILLSIQWKGFDLLLGATYNTYFFKINRLKPEGPQAYPASANNKYLVGETYVDKQFGFGFETSLKYTFPMKKRAAKKALE
jgi:hypothetical protein